MDIASLNLNHPQTGTSTVPPFPKAPPFPTIHPIPFWDVKSFDDAMTSSDVKPPWVIEDLLMANSATLVSAQPHAMKSLSWLQACLEAAAKQTVWGHFNAPNVTNTLFIETEDPAWLVEARIRGLALGIGLTEKHAVAGFHYVCPGPFELIKFKDFLGEQFAKYNPNFAVISTLQNTLGGKNIKEQDGMAPVMAAIIHLSKVTPLVVITHSPWDRRQRRAAGTVTQTANFLTAMHYQKVRNPKSGNDYAQVVVDSKAGALETGFYVALSTDGDPRDPGSVRRIAYGGKGWPKGTGKAAVLEAIEDDPDAAPKEIAEKCGVCVRYVQKLMNGSQESGTKKAKPKPVALLAAE